MTDKLEFVEENKMNEIIGASILFLVSVFAFIMSIRSFMEKGFLFNNAYLYASKQQRKSMDKKMHYRQSAVTFLLIGLFSALNGFGVIFNVNWLHYISIIVILIAAIYAIVSSILFETRKK